MSALKMYYLVTKQQTFQLYEFNPVVHLQINSDVHTINRNRLFFCIFAIFLQAIFSQVSCFSFFFMYFQ